MRHRTLTSGILLIAIFLWTVAYNGHAASARLAGSAQPGTGTLFSVTSFTAPRLIVSANGEAK